MITIGMIVKNEEKVLEECLQHLVVYGYEIVIADTGSTDQSKEIALKYTNHVYDYEWKNDFSDARNFVITKAMNEYILFVDSDEIVQPFEKEVLEQSIKENPKAIGRVLLINEYYRNQEKYIGKERLNRLFSKFQYEFKGRIHEQLVNKQALDNHYYDIPVNFVHIGYDGRIEIRKKKTQRNIQLLQQEHEINEEDTYIMYQLGKSYYMQEEYQTACQWFEKAFNYNLDTRFEYVHDMVESYGYALLESKRYEDALQLLNLYDEFKGNADFVFLVGLILMNNSKFSDSVYEFEKATKIEKHKIDGVNSYRANYNIGVIYECLGEITKAIEYYEKCEEYIPAIDRLKNLHSK